MAFQMILRDTAANLAADNPVLELNQIAIETDNGNAMKVGDAATRYSSLGYFLEPSTLATAYTNITNLQAGLTTVNVGTKNGATVSVAEYGDGFNRATVFTLAATPVTLVKNGTSTGGGGTLIYTFPQGLILPVGGTSNLTVANALDKSFLAAVGSAAAGTDGTLTSTEISFLPSTAATTSSGAGTCKMKSTVTTPTPGAPLDGTSSAVTMYLNSCLNADATGAEALTYSGTITILWRFLGDN